MLLWAVRAATDAKGEIHPDYHKQHKIGHFWETNHFDLEVTEQCVPVEAQAIWRETFTHAVDMMLERNLHGMQHGLLQIAHSVVHLIQSTSCGLLAHKGLDKLKGMAERLQVLASAGSLNDLDLTVAYEPMKGLTVGGMDIHKELNALIIAWQFSKGPEMFGRALADFLRDFREEEDLLAEAEAVAEPASAVSAEPNVHETRTPKFWTEVLQQAMLRLGGGHESMSEACLSASTARTYGDALEDAIARMLEKTRRGMQAGIKEIAASTVAFVDALQPSCSEAAGAVQLRSAASRMQVFASAKTLANFAKHVEYEPMQVLKVGGIDVHKEVNRFLVGWIHNKGAYELAEGLVDFFEDFKEHEVEEVPATPKEEDSSNAPASTAEELEFLAILRDAISDTSDGCLESADGCQSREQLVSDACHESPEVVAAFDRGVEGALTHMLKKERQSMALGLKELGDVIEETFDLLAFLPDCLVSHTADVVREGARKLRTVSRKVVADYDEKFITYEAMVGLQVGNVDVHLEINSFISAWKLRSHREAGSPLGHLMRKFATIMGHDEL